MQEYLRNSELGRMRKRVLLPIKMYYEAIGMFSGCSRWWKKQQSDGTEWRAEIDSKVYASFSSPNLPQ